MKTISSTLSSKGQITLPKTVREVMDLNIGDQVNFEILSSGEVKMIKIQNNSEAIYNLLSLLLQRGKDEKSNGELFTVTGAIHQGKTSFVIDFIYKKISNKKMVVIDNTETFFSGFNKVQEDVDNIKLLTAESLNKTYFEQHDVEWVIVDEVNLFEHLELLKYLKSKGINIIYITHNLNNEEHALIGNHYTISMNRVMPSDNNYSRNAEKIEHVDTQHSEIVKTLIYQR